ncbi:MAG: sigma-70 family RNA polymerase sigma factor [Deltaproteobacteria bacterium]|nr:sigma-70 family RNA polymerase sigma factor [Deltaproteobacteria bacterium]
MSKTEKKALTIDPEKWVEAYGDKLYQFALSRVHDSAVAEDLVQETFLAALKARKTFKGKSSVLTWMIGILRHKLIDHVKKNQKEFSVEDVEPFASASEDMFDDKGRWKTGPAKWLSNPMKIFEQHEFFKLFYKCLENIGTRLSMTFTLREVDGLDADEICKILDITTTNLWVILYRARLKLRTCLEENRFGLKR